VGGITVNLAWYDAINLPLSLVIIGLAAIGGTLVGWSNTRRVTAHEQVIRRTADLDAAAGDAVRGERVAVARDLHDVVSHAIAVMVMQAGAAQALYGHDRHRARAALVAVQQTARETLQELDRLVAAIGAGTMGAALVATGAVEHDSNDLNALVERMRGAGLRINLDLNCPLSGSVGAVVYRIVQESLTNAARHAPGAKVIVTVRTEGDEITVDVVDDGPGAASSSRRGYGLVGIAERVERLGGQLTTGPASRDTGFRVCARLPAVGAVST
jgi:signal transduction histidine kinase